MKRTETETIAAMSFQSIQAKLLAASLFLASACGTFAIFGCVPLLARLTHTPQIASLPPRSTPAATTAVHRETFAHFANPSARSSIRVVLPRDRSSQPQLLWSKPR